MNLPLIEKKKSNGDQFKMQIIFKLLCICPCFQFIIGSGLGLIHVMKASKNTDMSLVPVDYVNNALITAAWEVGTRQRDGPRETEIYNVVTSSENNLLWG